MQAIPFFVSAGSQVRLGVGLEVLVERIVVSMPRERDVDSKRVSEGAGYSSLLLVPRQKKNSVVDSG